jgi:hypothetical protein
VRIAFTTLSPTGTRRTSRWRRQQLLGRHDLDRLVLLRPGRDDEHLPLGLEIGVGHVDFHQEAIELRLRQRIGAFLFEGVLGRQDVERCWQRMILAGDGDAVLLHGLQQSRLGARAGAVDLVAISSWQNTGPWMKRNERRPVSLSSSTSEPTISGRHQVGVHCTRLSSRPTTTPSVSTSRVLARPGHADQQRVTAGEQRDKGLIDRSCAGRK